MMISRTRKLVTLIFMRSNHALGIIKHSTHDSIPTTSIHIIEDDYTITPINISPASA